ncbi:MAG: cytochrome c oxidase subunit 3, partial [Planctomycetes bacterium]|nr:cytochrome c oxidase subunit 3 [Planctomycetota bacterium]
RPNHLAVSSCGRLGHRIRREHFSSPLVFDRVLCRLFRRGRLVLADSAAGLREGIMHRESIDVSTWPRFHADQKHPFWWGILGLIAIETMVVAAFLVSFFYLWIVNVAEDRMGWPPPGTEPPPLLYPSINTGLLIVCAVSMWYSGVTMERRQFWRFVWTFIVCCAAGGAVMWLRWLQFFKLPFSWKENAYASFVWTLTGFHLMHVTSAVLGTALVGWFGAKALRSEKRRLAVQVDTMYWYFVSGIWIPIYVVLYWTPKWA